MAIKSDAESVKVLPSDNQNITSEAPKLLLSAVQSLPAQTWGQMKESRHWRE